MKLTKSKTREWLDLCIVLIIAAILSIFSISIHSIGKLYSFFNAYTDLPLAEFLINLSFLSVVGLLWITYIRWRKAAKRQEELENIISSISPDVLLVIDSDKTIIECNDSLKRMFGYQVDEVIKQKTDFLYFDRRTNPEYRREIHDMLERDGFYLGLATGKKKNGETMPLEIITGNLSGGGGAVLLLRDITERKRAEEVLRESERRFRRFASAVTDVIYRYDPKNNQYDFISPSFELQTGYSVEEIKADPSGVTRRITHPDDAERVFSEVNHHIKKGPGAGTFCTEYRAIRKDGQIIWVSDRKDIEFTPDGKVYRINGVIRDVTEHRRAEATLAQQAKQLERANEELKRKNAELDQFTYVASHDLQEPLRKVTAFSGMLRQDLGDNLPERAEKDLGFILDAAKRMQKLVQDLLTLSRSGRVDMKWETVSLNHCADHAIDSLAVRIEESGAEITSDELPQVWGDRTMLTQLYQNLLSNALKFTGANRPQVRLTAERIDGQLIFGVKDNGIGIEPRYAEQIFAPFKRLHGRGEYEGTGIGLAICHKTIERHGGKIWVESSSGKGAHFKFTIGEMTQNKREESSWDNSMENLQSSCSPKMTPAIRN